MRREMPLDCFIRSIIFPMNRISTVSEDCHQHKYKLSQKAYLTVSIVVVVLLFYVHGKHLRSCRDSQLT